MRIENYCPNISMVSYKQRYAFSVRDLIYVILSLSVFRISFIIEVKRLFILSKRRIPSKPNLFCPVLILKN